MHDPSGKTYPLGFGKKLNAAVRSIENLRVYGPRIEQSWSTQQQPLITYEQHTYIAPWRSRHTADKLERIMADMLKHLPEPSGMKEFIQLQDGAIELGYAWYDEAADGTTTNGVIQFPDAASIQLLGYEAYKQLRRDSIDVVRRHVLNILPSADYAKDYYNKLRCTNTIYVGASSPAVIGEEFMGRPSMHISDYLHGPHYIWLSD